eukprot:Phypoly_transcript_12074.p1 GENE.Phypoly_transcript_12074~~Phypoly_transcript_12074.p1  ORF type:complete len:362 (+),score=71.81 Phypoly_transcript_12074:67-1152(+)
MQAARPLIRHVWNRAGREIVYVRRYVISKEEFAAVMQDNDKLGLKSLVQIFGKTRNKSARQLEAKKAIEGQGGTQEAYNKILLDYSSSANTQMSEEVFEIMQDLEKTEGKKLISVDTYNALLSGYCNAGKMENAEKVVEEMKEKGLLGKKGEEGYITHALLVNGYAKSNREEQAIEAMRNMEHLGMKIGDEVVNSIISVLVRKGLIDRAVETAKQVTAKHNIPLSSNALFYLLEGHTGGKVQDGEKLMDDAKKNGTEIQSRMYNTLILNFGKAGEIDKSFQILQKMRSEGFTPDIYTYNSLLHICDKKNLTEKAFEIFEEMKKSEIKPSGETYGSLESLATRNNRNDLFRKHCGDYFYLQR